MADGFVGPTSWGNAVLLMKVDRAKMLADLKDTEKLTNLSSSRMASSLGKVGRGGFQASQGLNAMQKAAALTGSSSLALLTTFGELSLVMKEIKVAAAAAFGPIGLLVAALGGAVAIAVKVFRFRRNHLKEQLEASKKAAVDLHKELTDVDIALHKRIRLAREAQLKIRFGAESGESGLALKAIRAEKELAALQRRTDKVKQAKDERKARMEVVWAIREETQAIEDGEDLRFLGLKGRMREAVIAREQALQERRNREEREKQTDELIKQRKEFVKLAREEQSARNARRLERKQELGLGNRRDLVNELRTRATTELGSQLLRARQIKLIPLLSPDLQVIARQMLGVSTGQGVGGVGGSAAALGGVRQALSAGGVAFGGVSKELDISKLSLKQLEKIEEQLKQLVKVEKGLGAFEEN